MQNIEPEITGKLIDSLWQNLNEDSQARQVKNPERRNQADDAGKILLEETLKGNVSSAKVNFTPWPEKKPYAKPNSVFPHHC